MATASPRRSRFSASGVAFHDDPPAGHDRDALREPVGLLEVVSRQQNRQLLCLRQPGQLLPHGRARLRIEAGRRLVEEQHAWAVHETHRDVEAAFLPS